MKTEIEIIKDIQEIINHNKFTNDLFFQQRGEQNIRLEKAIKIIRGEIENERK